MLEKYKKMFFASDLTTEKLIFNLVVTTLTLTGAVNMVVTGLTGGILVQNMITIVTLAIVITCFYFANYRNALENSALVLCMVIGLVFFPALYFLNDAEKGGMSHWFSAALIVNFLLLRGIRRYTIITIEIIVYGIIFYVGYTKKEYVSGFIRESIAVCDHYVTAICVAICLGFMFSFIMGIFEKQMAKMEEQRIRMEVLRIEAEKASVAKSDFLANMSHEIRTPMNAIIGMARIALRSEMNADVRDNINDILRSSRSLLTIINDILDFSKIESGRMEINPAPYQFSNAIRDITTIINFRIRENPVEFKQMVDGNIPDNLFGDEVRVKQILTNILGNAAKFTKQGTIILKVDYEKIDDENIMLKVSISDTGQGIRPENLEKIFKRFSRAEMEINQTIEGTGLGLSITKELLNLMNGEISVESEYGLGSTFYINLPQKVRDYDLLYSEAIEIEHDEDSSDEYVKLMFRNTDVLVVDDNLMNLKVCRGLLSPYGIEAECVSSGKEALLAVQKKQYDLILMDHMMPEMDGVETLWRMREKETFATPVVVLTANAMNGVRKMYIGWGFNEYLSKPLRIEELEKVLKKYLEKYIVREPVEAYDRQTPSFAYGSTGTPSEPENKEAAADAGAGGKPALKHIDVDHGLQFSMGKDDFYRETLEIYLEETTKNEKLMEGYLEQDNVEDYTILVHALKSNSRMIGALELGELAATLESRGKEKDMDFIRENHKPMTDLLHEVRKEVRLYCGIEETE